MGVGCQRHAPAALSPRKTRYRLCWRLGGPQTRSGRVREISPPSGIRSADRPARSESLYRLSYPGRGYFSERNLLEELVISGMMTFQWIVNNGVVGPWLNSSGSGKGQVEGFCIHGDEPSGFRLMRVISWLCEELSASEEGLLFHEVRNLNSTEHARCGLPVVQRALQSYSAG